MACLQTEFASCLRVQFPVYTSLTTGWGTAFTEPQSQSNCCTHCWGWCALLQNAIDCVIAHGPQQPLGYNFKQLPLLQASVLLFAAGAVTHCWGNSLHTCNTAHPSITS